MTTPDILKISYDDVVKDMEYMIKSETEKFYDSFPPSMQIPAWQIQRLHKHIAYLKQPYIERLAKLEGLKTTISLNELHPKSGSIIAFYPYTNHTAN